MSRIPMDAFEEGEEIVRVYLAASVGEAQAVEAALDAAGLDYGVEVEEYAARSAFLGSVRRGAGFWLAADQAPGAIDALERAALTRGLVKT
jgi:hypothetical protein